MSWLKKSNIRDCYTFAENPAKDFAAIKIIQGPFEGVVYKYGRAQFGEELENGEVRLQFEYTILYSPYREYDHEAFIQVAGDILVDILERKFVEGELPILPDELNTGE